MLQIYNDEFLVYDDGEARIPRNINFLIVDDDTEVSDFLSEALDSFGFTGNKIFAHSVEEAISLCNRSIDNKILKIDYILCDWNLGALSGLDFLMVVRGNKDLMQIPFVMVTANDNVSGMLVATKKGCSDYLVKPFTLEELQLKIAIAWEKHL